MSKAYLEVREVERLVEEAPYLRDKLLIRLTFCLGCRISETLGIATGDIDFNKGTITIKHLKARIKLACPQCGARLGRSHIFCPRCGMRAKDARAEEEESRKVRTLPVDEATLEMLREYISRGGPTSQNGKQLLFGITRNHAWQIVRECAERAGLPKLVYSESGKPHGVSPHRLRDAFAINAVKLDDSGDGLRMLQEQLGHKSISTTMRYRKLSGEEQREWYDKVMSEM